MDFVFRYRFNIEVRKKIIGHPFQKVFCPQLSDLRIYNVLRKTDFRGLDNDSIVAYGKLYERLFCAHEPVVASLEVQSWDNLKILFAAPLDQSESEINQGEFAHSALTRPGYTQPLPRELPPINAKTAAFTGTATALLGPVVPELDETKRPVGHQPNMPFINVCFPSV